MRIEFRGIEMIRRMTTAIGWLIGVVLSGVTRFWNWLMGKKLDIGSGNVGEQSVTDEISVVGVTETALALRARTKISLQFEREAPEIFGAETLARYFKFPKSKAGATEFEIVKYMKIMRVWAALWQAEESGETSLRLDWSWLGTQYDFLLERMVEESLKCTEVQKIYLEGRYTKEQIARVLGILSLDYEVLEYDVSGVSIVKSLFESDEPRNTEGNGWYKYFGFQTGPKPEIEEVQKYLTRLIQRNKAISQLSKTHNWLMRNIIYRRIKACERELGLSTGVVNLFGIDWAPSTNWHEIRARFHRYVKRRFHGTQLIEEKPVFFKSQHTQAERDAAYALLAVNPEDKWPQAVAKFRVLAARENVIGLGDLSDGQEVAKNLVVAWKIVQEDYKVRHATATKQELISHLAWLRHHVADRARYFFESIREDILDGKCRLSEFAASGGFEIFEDHVLQLKPQAVLEKNNTRLARYFSAQELYDECLKIKDEGYSSFYGDMLYIFWCVSIWAETCGMIERDELNAIKLIESQAAWKEEQRKREESDKKREESEAKTDLIRAVYKSNTEQALSVLEKYPNLLRALWQDEKTAADRQAFIDQANSLGLGMYLIEGERPKIYQGSVGGRRVEHGSGVAPASAVSEYGESPEASSSNSVNNRIAWFQ